MSNTDQDNTKPLPQVDYNDGRWHGWNGGDCPVHPLSKVEARIYAVGEYWDGHIRRAHEWTWDIDGDDDCDIIAFRVIEPYVEPQRIWVVKHQKNGKRFIFDSKEAAQDYADDGWQITEMVEVQK